LKTGKERGGTEEGDKYGIAVQNLNHTHIFAYNITQNVYH